jgi:flagellar hook-length control protein FliK
MQIFNMLSGMQGSHSATGEVESLAESGEGLSQEEISAFLDQLELAFSQLGQDVEGALPWSEIQGSEEGALVDQSGNLLPLAQFLNGQLLPLHANQKLLPEESVLMQIKMAAAGEQAKSSPQLQIPLQPQAEKVDSLAGLQLPRAVNSEMGAASVLPAIAVMPFEQTSASSHLPGSFLSSQVVPSPIQSALTQLPAINYPVTGKGWGESLGQRIQWMVRQNIQGAEVKLNPRGLGPIEIRVTIQNDQANVSFVAHHAVTREAIDAAIPRLREMFGDSNMNLVNVDVSDRNSAAFGEAKNSASGKEGEGDDAMNLFDDLSEEDSAEVRLVSNGILDDYA